MRVHVYMSIASRGLTFNGREHIYSDVPRTSRPLHYAREVSTVALCVLSYLYINLRKFLPAKLTGYAYKLVWVDLLTGVCTGPLSALEFL